MKIKQIVNEDIEQQIYEACWKGYHKEGNKKMFGKTYPNCVKNTNEGHELCPECGGAMYSEEMINEKKDACYYKVKSRYKVWPSAYASGALVKCRKKGASNWGTGGKKNESEDMSEASASGDSSLHDWFTKSKSSDGTGGWVQLGGKYAGKPCAKQPGQKTKPKCGSSKMKRALSDKEEEAAARRKRKEDPNPNRSGKARNVATKSKRKTTEETQQVDEKWSQKYKSSINCSNPKGFSQKAHCAGKKKK